MISVQNLGRSYPTPAGEVPALRGVTFDIPVGSFAALAGRSGSGKTTLLNCIGALDLPTSGRVQIGGDEITTLSEAERTRLRRTRISFIFQTFGLLPMLSAAENVGLPLRLERRTTAERQSRVRHLLELVGLSDHADQRPAELSGGQQQRVAIARALANTPQLLIADEPTGQLDAENGEAILDLLRTIVRTEGTTALISTHDPRVQAGADVTLRLADGVLQNGRGLV
ncbi:ABC transporter [Subtercola sp. Z020]|nr:ABC transporter [Subtercola sp. Z020]